MEWNNPSRSLFLENEKDGVAGEVAILIRHKEIRCPEEGAAWGAGGQQAGHLTTQRHLCTEPALLCTEPTLSCPPAAQGTEILLKERAKDGYFGQPNAYWMLTLFSLNGRPWPALPVLVFALYAAGVCAICIYGLGLDSQTVVMLSSLRDVATIIGLAVFLLLSFRNQAAYSRRARRPPPEPCPTRASLCAKQLTMPLCVASMQVVGRRHRVLLLRRGRQGDGVHGDR